MNRREFLQNSTMAAVASTATIHGRAAEAADVKKDTDSKPNAYKYRIGFGCWMNDVRLTPLPLEEWPAPQLDDTTVESLIRTMDVQRDAGFNMFDVWGFFATYGWPADIVSAVTPERRERVNKVLKAARERGIQMNFGLGTYSWGFDTIIAADPAVRGKMPDGSPHA